MKKLFWQEYYENFGNWSESTQISYLSKLENVGSSDEVCEIALSFLNEKAADKLIKKALDFGVKFSADNLSDLHFNLSDQVFNEALLTLTDYFNSEQLELLIGDVDSVKLNQLILDSLNHGVTFTREQVSEWMNEDLSHETLEKMYATSTGIWDKDVEEELKEILYPSVLIENIDSQTFSKEVKRLTKDLKKANRVKKHKKGWIRSSFEVLGLVGLFNFFFERNKKNEGLH